MTATPSSFSPSASLVEQLCAELACRPPFERMAREHVERFVCAATLVYFAPGETVLAPQDGTVTQLLLVRQGSVTGHRRLADAAGGYEYEPGDLFPVAALLGGRAVTATYTAHEDTFCLRVPGPVVRALAEASVPFADHLNRRVASFLERSRQALQADCASQVLAEQSLEAPLDSLPRKVPLTASPETPLAEALAQMHARHVGSVLVVDAQQAVLGILTRHDVLGRIALPQLPLSSPIAQVMTTPVHTLTGRDTALDAALLMSRHGVRHVPVTDAGRLASIVSERDLFALQRLSLKQVSTSIRAARDLSDLVGRAMDIRRFARGLLGQGVAARQLTELISHLNDALAEQVVALVARRRGADLSRMCWLAFGSEGRAEQTIATDQDNGIVFDSDDPARDRPAWLALAREVNEALDACGYPLCTGQVMASNPACCLGVDEWVARFDRWMEQGAPDDLLNASIYFDLRPVAGRGALGRALRERITTRAAQLPRFIKQLAVNSLAHRPPLNWRGAIDAHAVGGRDVIDLKLQGTAIFVDVARVYALAQGVEATGTRARLEAVGVALGVGPHEREAWIGAFEFLQLLRLRTQLDAATAAAPPAHANLLGVASLNDIDRRMLKETLRIARNLQQRMELDYER